VLCLDQTLKVCNTDSPWLSKYEQGQELVIPVKNGEGCYQLPQSQIKILEDEGMVFLKYVGDNPNGSMADIAGVRNAEGNVIGLMPHPEHAIDSLTGPSGDGLGFFESIVGR
jgi:phosphoribosylformylglycinamidine (FGAM) synthase-like amidotransferase family enzyme